MRQLFILSILALSINYTKAQTMFFKTISDFDEFSNHIEQTADGGYLIAGTGVSDDGLHYSAFALKTDSMGDTLWAKTYGTSSSFQAGQQTIDGGYIFVGTVNPAGISNDSMYIVKTNSFGNIQWQKNVNGNSDGSDIKQTADGGYIILGNGMGASLAAIYIAKLDATGNLQWCNILDGTHSDIGYSVEEALGSGYIITGAIYSSTAGAQMLLIKLNNSGIVQWSKALSGSGYDVGKNIIKTFDNSYMLLGSRKDTVNDSYDMSLIKLDSSGIILWSKYYSGALTASYSSIKETNDGKYIISSSYYSFGRTKMLFSLIDSNGNILWSRFFGNTGTNVSSGKFAQQTADHGYIFTGNTNTSTLGSIIYFIKADSLGLTNCNDSSATLTVNPFTPIINSLSIIPTTGISISSPTLVENNKTVDIITNCIFIGIKELSSVPEIFIYPNPAQNMVNINYEISGNKGAILNIYDFTGNLITTQMLTAKENTFVLNTSNLANGVYLCTLVADNSISSQRLIIAK